MMYLVTKISNLYYRIIKLKNLTLEDAQCVSSGVIFFLQKKQPQFQRKVAVHFITIPA